MSQTAARESSSFLAASGACASDVAPGIRRAGVRESDPAKAARALADAILQPDTRFAVFYCSPKYDLDQLGAALAQEFEGVDLIGCTTAGEISPLGYTCDTLVGASLAGPEFTVVTSRIDELSRFEVANGEALASSMLEALASRGGPGSATASTFAFLLIDGLSQQEEAIVSSIYQGLGNVPLFGGSAADETRFQRTFVFHQGKFRADAALVTLVRTERPCIVFKTQHFVSSEQRMVVTRASPERRVVTEINGAPAGREYARMVGLEVDKLTPLIFSTYPVVVRVGGAYFVRSIQKVNDDESLTFFCAIDEGIVLTVARGIDFVANLEHAFADVSRKIGAPELVLGCDCVLRNIEVSQRNLRDSVSRIFRDNNVIGFATYGEQFNAMHVNQTFTGVALGRRGR
ncbi:MAG TPA: nitric oxide-sensing protein NosP [Polyangiaceae bacterium]|nr:nitric oxide-sensing protein NosP [Polyangiaceae bacterium]